MAKFELKKLPKDFRYLFTVKEIKEIENLASIKFDKVINGNLTNSEKFDENGFFQSHFRGFSIQGKMIESIWKFSLHQNGFRQELLPKEHEEKIKIQSFEKVKKYLNQISFSKETDLYKNPQLIAYISFRNGEGTINWSETKG